MSIKDIANIVAVIILLCAPMPSMALEGFKDAKLPDTLNSELNYLLALVGSGNTDTFELGRIEKVLNFIDSPKSNAILYYADKKIGADSAYYEFDIRSNLNHILRYAFNPEIPSSLFMPSSVRLSYWSEVNGQKQSLPKLWRYLSNSEIPMIVKGVEHIENTPDIFTGAYYQYDVDKILILCRYQGRNLLISVSKQKDKSKVGRKGLILGKDEDWHYFYSEQVGLTKTGLGWVDSYIYDSYNVSFYYEVDAEIPLVRCGTFSWLKAGWANFNLVKKQHIHKGLARWAKDFKELLEHPLLPTASALTQMFADYSKPSLDDLKKKVKSHIKKIEDLLDNETHRFKSFVEHLKSGRYLNQMTKHEMQTILVLENMKSILRQRADYQPQS